MLPLLLCDQWPITFKNCWRILKSTFILVFDTFWSHLMTVNIWLQYASFNQLILFNPSVFSLYNASPPKRESHPKFKKTYFSFELMSYTQQMLSVNTCMEKGLGFHSRCHPGTLAQGFKSRLKVSVEPMFGGQWGAGNFSINVKQSRSHQQEFFYLLWHFKANALMHRYLLKHQTAPLRKKIIWWHDKPIDAYFAVSTDPSIWLASVLVWLDAPKI